ncbi:SDR family NAD(P)-dependent oxidoreductase [Polycladidibacter hongkongensis]|uniref:SDR family NAD(P)-dependent oxidoreductase n=1 Tax=Polycladidibacter hongkongensis TaxID=1647556 RepID=UPI00082EEE71|nr:SDR family oxidoreductase [Pseudovibrio hongkongensis]
MATLPKLPSMDLNGKTALVTGASSGIGQGCAAALGQAGAYVICAARGVERLEETRALMHQEGYSAEAVSLDQSNLSELKALIDSYTPEVIINSAGLARHKPALETTPEDFGAVTDVNLKSAYFLSTYAAGALIRQGKQGSIIHISSQMGHVGGIDRTLYCATKHALEGMIKAMAIEWGKHAIRINSISPTFVRTPLTQATFDDPERRQWIMDKIKLPRPAEVEDIMGAALYLASDASAMMTGTSLLVDGGWTAG